MPQRLIGFAGFAGPWPLAGGGANRKQTLARGKTPRLYPPGRFSMLGFSRKTTTSGGTDSCRLG